MSVINNQDIHSAVTCSEGHEATIAASVIEPFSKNRIGMMGNHYSLTVELSEPAHRTLKFFVKTSSTALQEVIDDDWVRSEELEFLRDIHPRLLEFTKEKWSPRCYLAKPEILIFEDLRSQGYSIRPSGIYDRETLAAALSALARFHASSINLEEHLGKPLDQEYPGRFREKIFTDLGKGGRANKLAFETMALIAKDFEMDSDLVPKILNKLYELVKPKTGECNVICHGDLWRTNIMFKDSVKPPHSLLVDYQMLRYSSPTVDLAMLLLTHSGPESGDELELVQHYYAVLLENATKVPPWKDFLATYQGRRMIGLAYAATAWPGTVFDKFMNDPKALERWYFHERYSTYRWCMDEDKEYQGRLRMRLEALFEEAKKTLS